jgi:hypothetical protein
MDDALTTVHLSGGDTIRVKVFDGILWPPYVPGNVSDHLGAIRNLPGRPDDVVLATYPKSGRCYHFVSPLYNTNKHINVHNSYKVTLERRYILR